MRGSIGRRQTDGRAVRPHCRRCRHHRRPRRCPPRPPKRGMPLRAHSPQEPRPNPNPNLLSPTPPPCPPSLTPASRTTDPVLYVSQSHSRSPRRAAAAAVPMPLLAPMPGRRPSATAARGRAAAVPTAADGCGVCVGACDVRGARLAASAAHRAAEHPLREHRVRAAHAATGSRRCEEPGAALRPLRTGRGRPSSAIWTRWGAPRRLGPTMGPLVSIYLDSCAPGPYIKYCCE
jgi:hypothetical protein